MTMIRAILLDDIISVRINGDAAVGVPLPSELRALPDAALRYDGSHIIDVRARTEWFVDHTGRHIAPQAGRQRVTCAWDERLIEDGGVWRPMSASDEFAPRIKAECERRIFAVASVNTQMNLTAAQAAGRLSAVDAASYASALDWVDAMRARCAALIAAADAAFANDDKWPTVPSDVVALAAKF